MNIYRWDTSSPHLSRSEGLSHLQIISKYRIIFVLRYSTHTIKTFPTPHLWHIPFLWCYFHLLPCRYHFLPFRDKHTSQARSLNRKGENIASNPASYVTLKPASKKHLASKQKKDTQPVSLHPWLPVPKDVTISIKTQSQGSFFSHSNKASVKTI